MIDLGEIKALMDALLGPTWWGKDAARDHLRRNIDDLIAEVARLRALIAEEPSLDPNDPYEYCTMEGGRKSVDPGKPEGEGWEVDKAKGRDGWERFDNHEEYYYRRLKK